MSLKPPLEAGKFVVTAEVGPLKGTDTAEIEEIAELLSGKIDAANVTDQQSSVMRLGSLVTCHLLKERGLEPVLQITCRDDFLGMIVIKPIGYPLLPNVAVFLKHFIRFLIIEGDRKRMVAIEKIAGIISP